METNLENKIKELENKIKAKDRQIDKLFKEIEALENIAIADLEKTHYLMSLFYDIFKRDTKVFKANNLSFSHN